MRALGIDPGATGGLALVERDDRGKMTVLDAMMMPVIHPPHAKKPKPTVDYHKAMLFCLEYDVRDLGVIESVHAFRAQGVSSSFQFGRMFGGAEMLLADCDKQMYVSPTLWKPYYGLGSAKHASIELATIMFRTDEFWKLKKHDGVAEAALLAAYGLEKELGNDNINRS